jgi:hypothetical protein
MSPGEERSMPSRVVVQFQKHTGSLLATLQAHAPAIAEAVRTQTRAPAHRAGLDADALLPFVARSCDEKLSALLAADDAHARELSDDEAPRTRRDASAAALRTEILDVKQSVLALFGDAWAQQLGLAGEIPVDPSMLARIEAHAVEARRRACVSRSPEVLRRRSECSCGVSCRPVTRRPPRASTAGSSGGR